MIMITDIIVFMMKVLLLMMLIPTKSLELKIKIRKLNNQIILLVITFAEIQRKRLYSSM